MGGCCSEGNLQSDSELTLTSESTQLSGPTVKGGSWELIGGNGTSPSATADVVPEEQDSEEELDGWVSVSLNGLTRCQCAFPRKCRNGGTFMLLLFTHSSSSKVSRVGVGS